MKFFVCGRAYFQRSHGGGDMRPIGPRSFRLSYYTATTSKAKLIRFSLSEYGMVW